MKNLIQGSKEWLEWRKKGIGSSDISSVIGVSPYKTAYKLWLEKTGQVEPEDLSLNFNVQRGQTLEPLARELFNNNFNKKTEPVVFCDENYTFLRYSSDGFSEGEIIEIKCLGDSGHEKALSGEIPDYYLAQVQFGLMVSRAKHCYYISYNPGHEKELSINKIEPDLKYQENLLQKAIEFWDCVTSLTPPDLTAKDKVKITDDYFVFLANQIAENRSKIKELEADNDLKEKEIIEMLEKNKFLCAEIGLCTIQKVARKGNVDYAKIPELKGLNLEQYRKKSTSYYKKSFKDE
jgi:putative phage-type endonuclease